MMPTNGEQRERREGIAPSPHSALHIFMVVWVPVMRNLLRISEYAVMNSFLRADGGGMGQRLKNETQTSKDTAPGRESGASRDDGAWRPSLRPPTARETHMAGFMWLCATRASWRMSDGANFVSNGCTTSTTSSSISPASWTFSSSVSGA